MKKFVGFVIVTCIVSVGFAQDTRNVVSPKPPAPQYQSVKKEKKGFFSFLKRKDSKKSEVEKFRERLSKVYKQKAKEQRKAEKPQFSNPSYFGHKRPPKKRKPGKQKFCETCGIKH